MPGETKDSVSVKKLMAGKGDLNYKKEVLGWRIAKHLELLQLLAIPDMQRRMGRKKLERLVGKIRSMHLAVPGAVAHIYHIQRALTQGGRARA